MRCCFVPQETAADLEEEDLGMYRFLVALRFLHNKCHIYHRGVFEAVKNWKSSRGSFVAQCEHEVRESKIGVDMSVGKINHNT